MNRWNWRRWVLPPLLCCWAVGIVHAEITQSDRDLVERVSHRLLAVTDPVPDYIWPPTFGVLDDEKRSTLIRSPTTRMARFFPGWKSVRACFIR